MFTKYIFSGGGGIVVGGGKRVVDGGNAAEGNKIFAACGEEASLFEHVPDGAKAEGTGPLAAAKQGGLAGLGEFVVTGAKVVEGGDGLAGTGEVEMVGVGDARVVGGDVVGGGVLFEGIPDKFAGGGGEVKLIPPGLAGKQPTAPVAGFTTMLCVAASRCAPKAKYSSSACNRVFALIMTLTLVDRSSGFTTPLLAPGGQYLTRNVILRPGSSTRALLRGSSVASRSEKYAVLERDFSGFEAYKRLGEGQERVDPHRDTHCLPCSPRPG